MGCHAPELVLEVSAARARKRSAILDFSAQSSYELGSLAFRVLAGELPYNMNGQVLDMSAPLPPLPAHFPPDFKEVLRGLVQADPRDRMSLEAAIAKMEFLSDHVRAQVLCTCAAKNTHTRLSSPLYLCRTFRTQ
jgi:hypothetical protein